VETVGGVNTWSKLKVISVPRVMFAENALFTKSNGGEIEQLRKEFRGPDTAEQLFDVKIPEV
jgi:hypothetical protein